MLIKIVSLTWQSNNFLCNIFTRKHLSFLILFELLDFDIVLLSKIKDIYFFKKRWQRQEYVNLKVTVYFLFIFICETI